MLRVGLTGGIACGKTHVLRRLASRGLRTLDLDAVTHAVMAPGRPAFVEVVDAFGESILGVDASIDRKALGARIFADSSARERLNAIVHPRVRDEERQWAARHRDEPILVTDAALLVEAGMHLRFDRLVVVHCAPGEQLRRLTARDGLEGAAARARIAAQMPLGEKRRFAHFELDTSGSLEDMARATEALVAELRGLLPGPTPSPVPEARAAGCIVHGPRRGPRGLAPADLLVEIAEAGGIEMSRLARRLAPTPAVPWYRAGTPGTPYPGAEGLMGPVALWALARRGPDPAFVVAAAASVGRLFHVDGSAALADACLFALALLEVGAAGIARDLPGLVESRRPLAERWGGTAPSGRVPAIVAAACAHPTDPEAARSEAGDDLAGALVGLGAGVPPPDASPAIRNALGRLA